MREYDDIRYRSEWISVDEVNKGWSEDKKFHIKTKDNKNLLLRICDVSQYEKKKKEFEIIKDLNKKSLNMSVAIDYGICNAGESVYSLYSWINGYDAREKLNSFSKEEQYNLGVVSGKYLKEIHSIPADNNIETWEERFNKKIDIKIDRYKKCGIVLENDDKIISYLEENRELLKNRPQCFQHGDYHIGNMIITGNNELGIIDFNRFDYGDPWEEFNRIVWSAEVSPEFASGYINGYFENKVPNDFFKLMLLYISSNQISTVGWAKSFGEKEIAIAINQTKRVIQWYDNYKSYIPSWYMKY